MSWIDRLTGSRTLQALELTAQFQEARQTVLADNLANIDVAGHRATRLEPEAFEQSLREALGATEGQQFAKLNLTSNPQFVPRSDGSTDIRPVEEPAQNLLFHDGTNTQLEALMTATNQNGQNYELTMNLLRSQFESLLRAIRGRVT